MVSNGLNMVCIEGCTVSLQSLERNSADVRKQRRRTQGSNSHGTSGRHRCSMSTKLAEQPDGIREAV